MVVIAYSLIWLKSCLHQRFGIVRTYRKIEQLAVLNDDNIRHSEDQMFYCSASKLELRCLLIKSFVLLYSARIQT